MKEHQDKRTPTQILTKELINITYFFTPLICIHILALQIKPHLTDSPRGPWEIIWHSFLVSSLLQYRNDKLNNSLFLSQSLCIKWSILVGRGN